MNQRAAWGVVVLVAVLGAAVGCGRSTYDLPGYEAEAVAKLRADAASGASGDGAAAAVSTGTGWGGLKGVFRLTGAAPADEPLSTGGKDLSVCGAAVPANTMVVDPATQGIANVLVFARKVSRKFEEPPPAADAAPVLFDQKGCRFLTRVFVARVGVPMGITNSDEVGHNVNMTPQGNPGFNQTLAQNAVANYSFTRALSAPASATCSIHAWMKAYVFARDDGYVAVSGADGSFTIPNLPAGEPIEFQIWHERAAGSANGLEAKSEWAKGRFTVTIDADGVLDLGVIDVPATAFK